MWKQTFRGVSIASAAATITLALAAVAGGSVTSSRETVNLKLWSFATNIDKVVAEWNSSHPDIQVTVDSSFTGAAAVAKYIAATKAGNAPDLFQFNLDWAPQLVVNGVTSDLTSYVRNMRASFPAGAWRAMTFGGKTYGIPMSGGPMLFFYRKDIFKQYGIKVPKTWAEFEQASLLLRKKNPKKYMATFSAQDGGWFAALAQQAGANWWTQNADGSWSVSLNDKATQRLVTYWERLLKEDAVRGIPFFSTEATKEFADGRLVAIPVGVWGPGLLSSVVPKTKGKWGVAPMPRWSLTSPTTGDWGAAGLGISSKSKNVAAAVEFATWLTTSANGLKTFTKQTSYYPAATLGQTAAVLGPPPAFVAQTAPNYWALARASAQGQRTFAYGPNVDYFYTAYQNAFSAAINKKTSFLAALNQVNTRVKNDMKKSGYNIR